MRRIWSGLNCCPRAMAKARATWAEMRWRGRSTKTLKMCGMGLTNHMSTMGKRAARKRRVPPKRGQCRRCRRRRPESEAECRLTTAGKDKDQDGLIADMDAAMVTIRISAPHQLPCISKLRLRQARKMRIPLTSGMIIPMDLRGSVIHRPKERGPWTRWRRCRGLRERLRGRRSVAARISQRWGQNRIVIWNLNQNQ